MNIETLQQDFKDDLDKIKHLKLTVLSAKEAYVPLVYLFIKSFLLFYVTTCLSAALLSFVCHHTMEFFYLVVRESFFLMCGISFISTVSLGNYVIFRKMMIGEFKTAPFIQNKLAQMAVVFLGIYFTLTLIFFHYLLDLFGKSFVDSNIFLSELGSFLFAAVLINVVLSYETQRLGLSSLFEVVAEYFKYRSEHKKISK